ncbi:hypothetical protein PUN28_005357 [Cardiocondyla obscurior]|uniref:Uncharacterized protein n=1 Tax=Cardiocondyla obscurior TaxID=286306 RepID=A0AAW2GHB3_9HYME
MELKLADFDRSCYFDAFFPFRRRGARADEPAGKIGREKRSAKIRELLSPTGASRRRRRRLSRMVMLIPAGLSGEILNTRAEREIACATLREARCACHDKRIYENVR